MLEGKDYKSSPWKHQGFQEEVLVRKTGGPEDVGPVWLTRSALGWQQQSVKFQTDMKVKRTLN